MMREYEISNSTSGHSLGVCEGRTVLEAYNAMRRQAGEPPARNAYQIPEDIRIEEAGE